MSKSQWEAVCVGRRASDHLETGEQNSEWTSGAQEPWLAAHLKGMNTLPQVPLGTVTNKG